MIFVDEQNFSQSCERLKRFGNCNALLGFFGYWLQNKLNWKKYNPRFIRTYVYTGEFTPMLSKKIENTINNLKSNSQIIAVKDALKEKNLDKIKELFKDIKENVLKDSLKLYRLEEEIYPKVLRKREIQQKFFDKSKFFDFFVLETKPLKFDGNSRIYQKGVDVQLAVDFVSHAYKDNFDMAILCSGDYDLLESVKTVKSLGKKVLLFSHHGLAAKEMIRNADYYIRMDRLTPEELNKFSHIFENRNQTRTS